MFRLTKKEKIEVVTNCDHLQRLKFSPTLPHAFTEHGAIMLASVLNSKKAVEVSLLVVRAFVKLRRLLAGNEGLTAKMNNLEKNLELHREQIVLIYEVIKRLMGDDEPTSMPPKRQIGFRVGEPKVKYKARIA